MNALRHHAADARAFARYARQLPAHFAADHAPGWAEATIAGAMERREDALVDLLDRIRTIPNSPLRRLLDHAGAEAGDARPLVLGHGVEGALERLHAAGVFLSGDELKGSVPVVRPGLEPFTVDPLGLENPTAGGPATAGRGSSGVARRDRFELSVIAHEAAHQVIALRAGGLEHHDLALWRPVAPGHSGLSDVLRNGHLGRSIVRWFSQYPVRPQRGLLAHAAIVAVTRAAARRAGVPVPRPEHAPVDRAEIVSGWLAAHKAGGGRAVFLNTTSSSGVRVCAAAIERGHDISGTVMRLGGEPYTAEREERVAAAGCTAVIHYAMSEVGRVGNACTDPAARDDVHLLVDKLAVIAPPALLPDGSQVGMLHYTPLLPGAPKALLNIASDDYGVLEDRACGCPLGALDLTTHVHTIRSATKLNSEGMTFTGVDVLDLVERVLPGRFGGAPSDWQLAEEVEDGLTRVVVVASPRLGPVDEPGVADAVLGALAEGAQYKRLQTRLWREGGTVRVRREEPRTAGQGKILPLSAPRAPSRHRG
jgi:hypothetical protein